MPTSDVTLHVRALAPPDASQFQRLRLSSLRESPVSFGSSYEEEASTSPDAIERSLADSRSVVIGAFAHEELVGMVGLARESLAKAAHKGVLWGMYVSPAYRRQGVARTLIRWLQGIARSTAGLAQVNLSVNTANLEALSLYREAGFEIYGHERAALRYSGHEYDEFHMVWSISADE